MDFAKIRSLLFFALLVLVTIGFFILFRPFFYPIFWAAVIASIFYPLYRRLVKMIKSPALSSTLIMVLVFIIIVIPLTMVGGLVIRESISLYNYFDNNSVQIGQGVQNTLTWLQNHNYAQKLGIDQNVWIQKFSEFTKFISAYIFNSLKDLTQNSITFFVMFVLMFYTLYFFLKDGSKFLKLIMHLCPLGDRYEKILYEKFSSTALATIKSSLLVGAIQGTLGAILFYIVDIPGALIWGLLMTALCVLPIGSGFIWMPAGIILLITGQIWQGLLVLLVGTLVISTIDNLLRPVLIGKETAMHPVLILFSTLGGIAFFGLTGFLIGPIITSLLVAFWGMYDQHYKQELDNNK